MGLLYTENNILPANPGHVITHPNTLATGAGTGQKSVPALRGVHSNIIVRMQFAVAPTSGSITVVVEMD